MSYFANYMALYGARIAGNRWPALPIAPGEKYPGQFSWGEWEPAKAWQTRLNILPDDADLALWRGWPGCGIGICCGYIVGIDIDLPDGTAAFEAEQTARRLLGDTPFVRIGNYPKRMLVYRSEQPFASLNGAGVQILALGRQFVAFGVHPQTRKPYEWLEDNPVDCDSASLPAITETQARHLIAAIGKAPDDRAPRAAPNERRQSAKGQYGTFEAVRSAIEALPNPDLHYDDWIRIGLALKGSLPGDAARDLWLAWSAQSAKDDPSVTAKKWDSAMKNPVSGAGTLYYLAERAGWRAPSGMILNAADAGQNALPHPAQVLIEQAGESGAEEEEDPGEARISQSEFLKPGGALGQMIAEIAASSPTSPQPFLALAASLAALGALMGRRYRTETGLRSNLYVVGMADSGSGKNHARAWLRNAFMSAPELKPYLGADDLASASGLMTSLHGQAAQLFQIDELGQVMKGMLGPRANPHKKALWAKLTELYSQANGWVMGAAYANAKERPRTDTNQPCCCIYGTTVSKPFWDAMKSGEGEDGSLARWLIFIPEIMHPDTLPSPQPAAISESLRTSLAAIARGAEDHAYGGNLAELSPMRGDVEITPYTVPMAVAAQSSVQTLNEEQNAWLRSLEDNTKKAIVARYAENIQKIALILAVSHDPKRPVIQVKDIEYAKKLVKYCIETSMRGAEDHIAENEYEANRNKILNFIKKAKSKGVTLSQIIWGTKIPKRAREDILHDLIDGQMIQEQIITTASKPVRLYKMAHYPLTKRACKPEEGSA